MRTLCEFEGNEPLAFSNDSRRLAVAGSSTSRILVRDASSGRTLQVFSGLGVEFSCLAFSPDDRRLAAGNSAGSALVWQLEKTPASGQPPAAPRTSGDPDRAGRVLPPGAVARLGRPDLLHTPKSRWGSTVKFSPDGRWVATEHRGVLRRWDIESGRLTARMDVSDIWIISRDGRRIIEGGADGYIRIRDSKTGRPLRVFLAHPAGVRSLALLRKGQLLASGGERDVRLWNLRDGKQLHRFEGLPYAVSSLTFSPDGRKLVCHGRKFRWARSMLHVWQTETGRLIRSLDFSGDKTVFDIRFLSPNRVLLRYSFGTAIWHLDDQTRPRPTPKLPGGRWRSPLSVAPGGRTIASATVFGSVELRDAKSGKLVRRLERLFSRGKTTSLGELEHSPDGRLIVASRTEQIGVWQAETGAAMFILKGHTARLRDLDFSPDSRLLATTSVDNTLRVWDLRTGQVLAQFDASVATNTLALSADGKTVLAGHGKSIRVWDVATGKTVHWWRGHRATVKSIRLVCEGTVLISADAQGELRAWPSRPGLAKAPAIDARVRQLGARSFRTRSAASAKLERLDLAALPTLWNHRSTADLETRKRVASLLARLRVLGQRSRESYHWTFRPFATSPDGRILIRGAHRGLESRQADGWKSLGRQPTPEFLQLARDGRRLLSFTAGGKLLLLDRKTGKLLRSLSHGLKRPGIAAASADLRWIALAGDKTKLQLIERSGTRRAWNERNPFGEILALSFSPGGSLLAVGCKDGTIRLLEPRTGKQLRRLVGHRGPVLSLAWDATGRRLASGAADAAIYIWAIKP